MLEGLDHIQWSRLNHAYGSAEDVPDLIRSLMDSDDDIRDKTLYALYGNLWHQGTVYQATVYAVPFLIELLAMPDVTRKVDILIYLSHLAQGNGYLQIHAQQLSYERDEAFQHQVEEELDYVKRTYLAVCEGMDVYFRLLLDHHNDPYTRMAVPYLLSNFNERHHMIVPRLQALLPSESNRLMRASIILALRHLQHGQQDFDHLEPYLAPDEDWIVRVASAMTIAEIAGQNTPARVIDLLVETLCHTAMLDEDYEQLTWSESDLISDICKSLMYVGYEQLKPVLSSIVRCLRRVDFYSAMECVDALLFIVFDGKPIVSDTILSDHQRLVLETILESPTIWRIRLNDGQTMLNGNISKMMRSYNLPSDPEAMRAFLQHH